MTIKRARWISLILAALLVAASCSDDSTTQPSPDSDAVDSASTQEEPATEEPEEATEPEEPATEDQGVALADVCPDPIVIQTGWYPETDRAWFYALVGPDGEIDAGASAYRGPALADPNITIEVRAGGPAVGFQSTASLLYADRDILIAGQHLDAMINVTADLPTVGVFAPLELHPQILMWDPAVYQFDTIEDIRDSGATVLVSSNVPYAQVLAGLGLLDEDQIDASYDFSPSRFIVEGDLVQQGFATNEPHLYGQVLEDWSKPVDYLLVSEAGYPNYAAQATVRTETITEESDCLAALVPVMQQSVVDYVASPDEINALLVELTNAFNSPNPLSDDSVEFGVKALLDNGLVGNGDNTAVGDYNLDRVQTMIDISVPVLVSQGSDTLNPDISADELVTNQFIDPDIGL